jgi:tetratricopeptide (TPR) repeat protein
MMGDARRVFLSHTSELVQFPEARSFVAAAQEAVMRAGDVVADMAYFTARETRPSDYCCDVVRCCAVYVGVIGLRYGSPVRDRPEISYTELEFDTATEAGLRRLVFLLDEDAVLDIPASRLFDFEPDRRARQRAFRERLLDAGVTVHMVARPDELELLLFQALQESRPVRRPEVGLAAVAATGGRLAPGGASPAEMPDAVHGHQVSEAVVPAVPRSLPRDVSGFSGRRTELDNMLRVIDPLGGNDDDFADIYPSDSRAAEIIAISGTAGVGKTTLAIRFARQVAKRFPDGQLYVNLHGFDPSGSATDPDAVLRYFLDALAVPLQRMPADLESRAGLFRSMLDGKRVLIVLDNVRDPDQVRPLLPGSPGCLVVVTSRSQLTGLVAAEGATTLILDVLTEDDAHELLRRRLGSAAVAAEPQAVAELISLCARLPLALAVAAGRAVTRPGLSLADLASELRDDHTRLEALGAGDATTDVRAVLSWSYEQLSASAARMFRLLGLHPGPDVSVAAAASLAGISLPDAATVLRELSRARMVAEQRTSRFAFHDLLRAYALHQAEIEDGKAARDAAIRRLMDYYLHTAHAGALLSNSVRMALDLDSLAPGAVPEEFSGRNQALAWFEAEHPIMLRLLNQAIASGDDRYAWQITWTLAPFFYRRGRWHECISIQRQALDAAKRLNDPVGLGHAHYELGRGLVLTGDFAEAEPHLSTALDIFGRLGDRANEATVHQGFGALFETQGRYEQSLVHAREAMRVVEEIGPPSTLAGLQNSVGWLYAHLGQYEQALVYCERSLEFQREIGYRGGEADTLDSLGYTYSRMNNHQQAADCYQQAVDIYHEIGDRYHQAGSYISLGDAQLHAGELAAARESWEQALTILESIPHPDAAQARTRLQQIGFHDPAAGPTATPVTER